MVKIEIQLTAEQAKALEELSETEGRTTSDLARNGVEALLHSKGLRRRSNNNVQKRRALAAVGRFHSGKSDLAVQHDRYLNEAFES